MTDHVDPSNAVACPLSLGEASVHGPLTLHMALFNSKDFIRRAWTLTFTPWGEWGFLTPHALVQSRENFCGSRLDPPQVTLQRLETEFLPDSAISLAQERSHHSPYKMG
jgi:hypothetical protein